MLKSRERHKGRRAFQTAMPADGLIAAHSVKRRRRPVPSQRAAHHRLRHVVCPKKRAPRIVTGNTRRGSASSLLLRRFAAPTGHDQFMRTAGWVEPFAKPITPQTRSMGIAPLHPSYALNEESPASRPGSFRSWPDIRARGRRSSYLISHVVLCGMSIAK